MAGRYTVVENDIDDTGWTQVYTGAVGNKKMTIQNGTSSIDAILKFQAGDPGAGVTDGFELRRSSELSLDPAPITNIWARANTVGSVEIDVITVKGLTAGDLTS